MKPKEERVAVLPSEILETGGLRTIRYRGKAPILHEDGSVTYLPSETKILGEKEK